MFDSALTLFTAVNGPAGVVAAVLGGVGYDDMGGWALADEGRAVTQHARLATDDVLGSYVIACETDEGMARLIAYENAGEGMAFAFQPGTTLVL